MNPTLLVRLNEAATASENMEDALLLREAVNALREQNAMLVTKAPYPFCGHPLRCIPEGRCMRMVGGFPWNCAD